jgi:formate hydrogenlyase transcriptional activator
MVIRPHGDRTGSEHAGDAIIGSSPALQQVMDQLELVAPTDSTVLILGETGTGKELVARHIHRSSARSARPFLKLNCAAVPVTLFESELFGHEKGAFTDAIAQKVGRFELAQGGTLFLDEVGEIPLELQAKLLRVLQEREFERLGSTHTIRVDVRLIAATNRDLAAMVSERHFRSDLYYRLNVFPVAVPPLRERVDDIPTLVHYFLKTLATRLNKRIESVPSSAMAALSRYQWPGNIRELEHVIERAVILSRGSELEVPLAELGRRTEFADTSRGLTTLEELEREHIRHVLEQTHWLIGGPSGAATMLGIKRTTLQSKMIKFGIERPNRRPRQRDERLTAA